MSGAFLVFDIETVLDPELPIAESQDAKALPSPPYHRVIAIGALLIGADYSMKRLGIVGRDSQDEAIQLGEFADLVEKHRPTLVSFNGRSFDLPVIATRCLRHGIPFRGYYRSRDMRYRFTEEGHFDLMDFVADYGAATKSRLDVLAKLCGMPGKVGVDGKDVGPLYHAGRLAEIRDYCLCDVVQTAGVFLRVQLLRGVLGRAAYVEAMRGLIRLSETDERVRPVRAAMNVERLLLGEPLVPVAAEPLDSAEAEPLAPAAAEPLVGAPGVGAEAGAAEPAGIDSSSHGESDGEPAPGAPWPDELDEPAA
ncbi:MAG TPA: 3'-5' exonuclease [Polyangiaceae bacterium]|nr:3'-5' exonuclease [Polyangiaceae bacterium]